MEHTASGVRRGMGLGSKTTLKKTMVRPASCDEIMRKTGNIYILSICHE